jgi:hypothetical protein
MLTNLTFVLCWFFAGIIIFQYRLTRALGAYDLKLVMGNSFLFEVLLYERAGNIRCINFGVFKALLAEVIVTPFQAIEFGKISITFGALDVIWKKFASSLLFCYERLKKT